MNEPPYGVPPEHDGDGRVDGKCVVCGYACADQAKEHPACAISLGEVEAAYRAWSHANRYVIAHDRMHAEVNEALGVEQ